MNASKTGLLALVALASCYYSDPAYDCYYYYGYYDPYCNYAYYDPYTTSDMYRSVSYNEVAVEETPNPDPMIAAVAPDSTVAVSSYTYLARDPSVPADDQPDLSEIDDHYPCNEAQEESLALCSENGQKFAQDEDYVVVAFELDNPLPQDDATNFFVVGFSFDADGDPSNNFTPPAETANDYFGDTDTWYAASYTPTDGWNLGAFHWNGTAIESVPTTARLILDQSSAGLLAPASEFTAEVPGSRISLFRHTGDQGANGDWSGLVYPPLGAPLQGT